MITAEINGKIYSMDESDFAKNSKIVHDKLYTVVVLKTVNLSERKKQRLPLFSFELESPKISRDICCNYLADIGIEPIFNQHNGEYLTFYVRSIDGMKYL